MSQCLSSERAKVVKVLKIKTYIQQLTFHLIRIIFYAIIYEIKPKFKLKDI